MNIAPYLSRALVELDKSMQGTLDGTKISAISDTISNYALASAAASIGIAIIPGAGGVAAALAQTGLVWATYVKINKTLGISMSEETAKFLGSAIATNIVTQLGIVMAGHVLASVISVIPVVGSAGAAMMEAAIGYVLIYACSVIYLKLISALVNTDGTLNIEDEEATKASIREIMEREDMTRIFKEGAKQFNVARKDGSFEEAKKKRICKNCGQEVGSDARFCPNCGKSLE